MIIKKDNVSLTVHYRDEEVFILSDVILTAFDITTRRIASSEATLAMRIGRPMAEMIKTRS